MSNSYEGQVPFDALNAGKECLTWHKVFGALDSDKIPLIIVHGGPAACHEYLLKLSELHSRFQIPVIFYDQVGAGKSTHLPEKKGDESFWTEDLFHAELDNLVDHLDLRNGYDILGHSWGGMMGASYAAKQPKGLRRLVLASAPASIETFLVGLNQLKKQLPQETQDVMERCEREMKFDSKEYEDATNMFYEQFLCRNKPFPAPELEQALGHMMGEGMTVYETMYGVSEMVVTGNLKNWTVIDVLNKIEVETLLIHGRLDEAQEVSVLPFFQGISKVKWFTIEDASHFAHVEQPEKFLSVLKDFLLA